jgi:predicted DNA-binding transcriptional regulator AlpA
MHTTSLTNGSAPRLEAEAWHRAGISRAHAYTLMASGQFPRPVRIGRAIRFVSTEVDDFIAARVAERDSQQAA